MNNLLESYVNGELKETNSVILDKITDQLKNKVCSYIGTEFVEKNLISENTKNSFKERLNKQIITEYNTMTIPFFYILESLNLCVEVEMSDNESKFFESQKFGEKKLSDLLSKGGFEKPEPIKRFAISEKHFLGKILTFLDGFTDNYEVTEDSIKIQII